ncbi:MAG: acyl-CoA dehydrogenase family protein [Alphaproteobacteria bacterium]
MRIEFTKEQKQLRHDLRTYFADLMTPERKAATKGIEAGPIFRDVVRQMGKDGVLTLGWPKKFGGQGRGMIDQLILFEESWVAKAPFPVVTISTIAPALMQLGTEEQKKKYLPRIAAGEIIFAIGYSEPGAGTDLASLKTKAEPDGDDFIVNGTKVYTSGANGADHIWLATRTGGDDKPGARGISVMIVDTDDPGFSLAPIHTVAGLRTNMTYYDNIRVTPDRIVGGLNQGWGVIRSQLNHERISLAAMSINGIKCYLDLLEAAQTEDSDGRAALDDSLVQARIGEVYCKFAALNALNLRMAWQIDNDCVSNALAAGVKVFSCDELVTTMRLMMDLMGQGASLRAGSAGAELEGEIDDIYRMAQLNTFGGGAAEVMRCLVAADGLGLPNTIAR